MFAAVHIRTGATENDRQDQAPATQFAPTTPAAFAYTIRDACLLSGIGRTKLYELINAQHLLVSRAAGRVLVVGDSLRALFTA